MFRSSTSRICLALPFALMSQAALADLTPAEVWGDWRSYMEGMGYQMSATETARGADLSVSGITLGFELPEGEGMMKMTLGDVDFVQQGDGSVAVVMPQTMPVVMEAEDGGPHGDAIKMAFDYIQSGHAMTVSGDPTQMRYEYAAASISLVLRSLEVEDEPLSANDVRMNFTASDVVSATDMTIGAMRDYVQQGSMGALSYDVLFKDPDEPDTTVSMQGAIQGVGLEGGGKIPTRLPAGADVSQMIEAGFDVAGRFTYEGGEAKINVNSPRDGNSVITTNSTGGELGVAMGADGLAYDGGQSNLNFTMQVQDLPFPIELSMAESGFNLALPVRQSDTAQDFEVGFVLGGFKMSDMIWGMFDPAGQLPRDPATIVLDLSGKAKVLMNYLDASAAAQMGDEMPMEFEALDVRELLVDAVGARLEGTGALTFDNSDMTTVPGMPKPMGSLNFALSGANALIDKLVAMGLLPEDQAAMSRMMMGMFAVPGDAPDSLKSTIEFTPEGHILANGQRIK